MQIVETTTVTIQITLNYTFRRLYDYCSRYTELSSGVV